MSTLINKTKNGLLWSALERIFAQSIQLIVTLILARILGPTNFGLVGLLVIFISIANVFIDGGFSSALIRKLDRNNNDLTTAFYYNIAMSILCYFLIYITAPYIAIYYQQLELQSLLRVLGISILFNSFALIPRTILSIHMDFKTQAKVSIISIIISGCIAIILALYNFGVWALVAQSIVSACCTSFLFKYFLKWKSEGRLSKESFNYLFNFGNKLLISGLLDTIYNNLYQIIIGKKFDFRTVGEFTQANQLSSIPAITLTNIIQRVTYPMFSQIQNDDQRISDIYSITLKIAALVIFPIIMGLALVAKPLLKIILGNEWSAASILLSILCIGFMLYPIHAINLNLLQVKGRSDLFLKLELFKKIIGISILLVTTPYGIQAMCIGFTVTSYLSLYLNTYYTAKLTKISQLKQCKDLLPIWGAVMISSIFGYIFGSALEDTPWLQLTVSLTMAFICYFSYLILAQKAQITYLWSLLRS
uniref:Wzx n=1 Tax=Providencia alcalifaciens TaxID=126385 RepID=M9P0U4_9GAMM|nr:Wzx [Providencia alcalifaciens]